MRLDSDPVCSSAGCNQYLHMKKKSHDVDYFVPDYGYDHDLKHNDASLEWAENKLGRKWNWAKEPKADDIPAYIDNNPLDADMKTSLSNLKG